MGARVQNRSHGTRLHRKLSAGGMAVKRTLIVSIAVLIAGVPALGLLGVGPMTALFHRPIDADDHGGITRLEIVPVPEGPVSPTFARQPASEGTKPLSLVAQYIPDPLPATLYQGPMCRSGGDLIVTFADDSTVTYGPCRRPASIDRLWAGIVYVLEEGKCAPKCGPGGQPAP